MNRQRVLRFKPDESAADNLDNPFAHVSPYTHRQRKFKEFSDFEVESQAGIDIDLTVPTTGDIFQLASQPRQIVPILLQDSLPQGPSTSRQRTTSPTQDRESSRLLSSSVSPFQHHAQLRASPSPSVSPSQHHAQLPTSPFLCVPVQKQATSGNWVDTDSHPPSSVVRPTSKGKAVDRDSRNGLGRLDDEDRGEDDALSSSSSPSSRSNTPEQPGRYLQLTREGASIALHEPGRGLGTARINQASIRDASTRKQSRTLQTGGKPTPPFLCSTRTTVEGSVNEGGTVPFIDFSALRLQKATSTARPTEDSTRSPPHKRLKQSANETGPQAKGSGSDTSRMLRTGQSSTRRPWDVYDFPRVHRP